MKTNNFVCLDNNGETFDRYTILDKLTGDLIGASNNPFHPLGCGQFCGNVADYYWVTAYGSGWRRNLNKRLLNKRIKYAVNLWLSECSNIGNPVNFDELPEQVKAFAIQSFEAEKAL